MRQNLQVRKRSSLRQKASAKTKLAAPKSKCEINSALRQSAGAMVNFCLDFRPRAAYTKRMENEWSRGEALVTEELLDAARSLLSLALPLWASETMVAAFWQKVHDEL